MTPLRRRLLPAFVATCAGAVLLTIALEHLAEQFRRGSTNANPPRFGATLDAAGWLRWILGDLTEAQFYSTPLAGIGLILGAIIAALLARSSRRSGFEICSGTGLFGWVLLAAGSGLLLSNLLWGWTLSDGEWQPTFVPFVSVPAAAVLIYGPGLRVALTSAVLGAVTTTPVSIWTLRVVCPALDLPPVVANVTGMWLGGFVAFAVLHAMRWRAHDADVRTADSPENEPEPPTPGRWWCPRRVLADFTAAQFYGNEIASAGMILGALAAWMIATDGPSYGSGLFPNILAAQIIAGAIAVWLYSEQWMAYGWYPSFVPIVSIAPATVLAVGSTWPVIIAGAVLGAVAGPPVAHAIATRLPGWAHPYLGSVVSMTLLTALGIPLLRTLHEAGLL